MKYLNLFYSYLDRLSFRQIYKISKVLVIITLFLLLGTICSLSSLYAQDKEIVIGGKDGWPVLEKMDGVTVGKGRFGYDSIELETNSPELNSHTDIYLNFEGNCVKDTSGNYDLLKNNSFSSSKSIMGKKSALFKGTGGMELSGHKNSFFGSSGLRGSFSVDFWLCPSIVENGEVIFYWRSSRKIYEYSLYQMITSSFQGNKITWKFTNIFDAYTENNGEIEISSYNTIIPNEWAYHQLSFNDETGLLEYRIDGELENIIYVTTNKREEGGSVYVPYLGVVANVELCPSYVGLIDDFRIQTKSIPEESLLLKKSKYKNEGGRFETRPIMVSPSAILKKFDAVVSENPQTNILFYVRSGDNFYNWTESYPEWKVIENHEDVKDVAGLYFQFAADLFTDGSGKYTPSVTEIKLSFKEVDPPLSPYKFFAKADDGKVTLTWSRSVDSSVGGYLVYYGERPGEYLGVQAVEGKSPIDVGNTVSYTLSGLKNGKIYYFAVASYSSLNENIIGDLSKEVYARPLKK